MRAVDLGPKGSFASQMYRQEKEVMEGVSTGGGIDGTGELVASL